MSEVSESLAIIPTTGEEILRDAPSEKIVEVIKEIDNDINALSTARASLNSELLERMDKSAKWTQTIAGMRVTAPSPSSWVDYDVEALSESMLTLVDDDIISEEAFDETFSITLKLKLTFAAFRKLKPWFASVADKGVIVEDRAVKLSKRGLNSILKVGGKRAANLVDAATLSKPTERRATVKVVS